VHLATAFKNVDSLLGSNYRITVEVGAALLKLSGFDLFKARCEPNSC
jgi:hypothetical protein